MTKNKARYLALAGVFAVSACNTAPPSADGAWASCIKMAGQRILCSPASVPFLAGGRYYRNTVDYRQGTVTEALYESRGLERPVLMDHDTRPISNSSPEIRGRIEELRNQFFEVHPN